MDNTKLFEKLNKMSNSKLINAVKNYKQNNYPIEIRNRALEILKDRGITEDELELSKDFENEAHQQAEKYYIKFKKNSNASFFLSILSVFAVFSESMELFLLIYIVFLVFLLRSFINQRDFYKTIENESGLKKSIIYLILGIPLYFAIFFIVKKEMEDAVNTIE